MNLHPLTQAGKHEAVGMAEDLARRAIARRATLPSAPPTNKTASSRLVPDCLLRFCSTPADGPP